MKNRWKIGLLGKSLEHTSSPRLFQSIFESAGVKGHYEILPFETWSKASNFLTCGDANDFDGFNVTVPYKLDAARFCSDLTPVAQAVSAINVLLPQADGQYQGHNTDREGFMNSIRPFLASRHERALIIGRGGAAIAAASGLRDLGIEVVHLVRTLDATAAKQGRREWLLSDLRPEVVRAFLLIVQASPVGTWPEVNKAPDFLYDAVGRDHLCVDLVYNPAETMFLNRCKIQGALVLNGHPMLEAQALASWEAFQFNRQVRGI